MRRLTAGLLGLALLSGCGLAVPSRAVERLQPVETMGYDVQGDTVTVSVSSSALSGDDRPRAMAARGGSVPQAMENLRGWSDAQELFFAHVRYVVAGEAAARAGLGPLLDYFARSTQTSLELPLLVVRGGEAAPLVTASADPDREITALLSSMQRSAEQTGSAKCFTLREVARQLARSGAALCCAVESRPAEANVPSAEEGAQAVLCAGYAVLKNSALAGFLDTEAALGADLILGLAGQADYVLPCSGGSATASLLKSETELSTATDGDGALTVLVTTRVRAGILAADGADAADTDTRRELAAALARAAAAQEEAALAACRDMDADFLELRRIVMKKDPRAAGDAAFLRELRWQVRVEALVERSYDLEGGAAYG